MPDDLKTKKLIVTRPYNLRPGDVVHYNEEAMMIAYVESGAAGRVLSNLLPARAAQAAAAPSADEEPKKIRRKRVRPVQRTTEQGRDARLSMLAYLDTHPDVSTATVAEQLGTTAQTALYHLTRLADEGLISRHRSTARGNGFVWRRARSLSAVG